MSRHSKAMLCNVLWHHQGGSSPVGQPIREILGIGQHDNMTEEQLSEAKWIDSLLSAGVQQQAAPDLLEFAEEVRRSGDTRLASMAIAVIAKATGKEAAHA